ncbi:hypothetical protein HN011_000663 [Eciton burchellii]|nr:hypothetical protein HN011_000663 [Eciton burchellii]
MCEDNHPANYKNCMVYKDLKKDFLALREKVITPKPQSQTISASIQTRLDSVQPGRFCASVTRPEGRQSTTGQNNHAIQEQMISPNLRQFIAGVI